MLRADPRGQVPQTPGITLIRSVESASVELRPGRPVQQLRGRRLRDVVEIPQHDQATLQPVPIQHRVDVHPDGRRFHGPPVQGVRTEPGPLILAVGGARPLW